jgi:hypothetical protein
VRVVVNAIYDSRLYQSSTSVNSDLKVARKRTEKGAVDDLVSDFLTKSNAYSLREAAKLSGLNHETIAQMRRGGRPQLHQATRRKMQEFIDGPDRPELSTVSHETSAADAMRVARLLLAAEQLEKIAAELRAEAEHTEPVNRMGSIDVVRAHRVSLPPKREAKKRKRA